MPVTRRKTLRRLASAAALGCSAYLLMRALREGEEKATAVAFPDVFLDELSMPLWAREDDRMDCTVPVECSGGSYCDQKCGGSSYKCVRVADDDTFYGKIKLRKGKSYCLPKKSEALKCAKGVSRRVITYNQDERAFEYYCKCKYPEFFAGPECGTFVACNGGSAPLLDALDYDRPLVADARYVDFHETLASGAPRYYCGCKKADTLYSSGYQYIDCLRDPCFPLATGSVSEDAQGLADGLHHDPSQKGKIECACGDPAVTKLFGSYFGKRDVPCLPVMTDGKECTHYTIDSDGMPQCVCEGPNQVFWRCSRNRPHMGYEDYNVCTNNAGPFVTRGDAPQAGRCVDPCDYCRLPCERRAGIVQGEY